MKLHGPMRKFVAAFAIVCVVVGAVWLGLGLSSLNYIRWEQSRAHQVVRSDFRESTTFFARGAVLCLVGILLWLFGKRGSA